MSQRVLRHTFSNDTMGSDSGGEEEEEPLTPSARLPRAAFRRAVRSMDDLPPPDERRVSFVRDVEEVPRGSLEANSDASRDERSPGDSRAQRRRLLAPISLEPVERPSFFADRLLLSPIAAVLGGQPSPPGTPRTPLARSLGVAQWVALGAVDSSLAM